MPALGLQRKEAQAETFSFLDDPELMDRATAAWHRSLKIVGAEPIQPNALLSETLVSDQTKHRYAVLQNVNGVLAVYMQPLDAEKIIRIETWPEGLGASTGGIH